MQEVTVSGAIKWEDDRASYQPDGHYMIRSKIGQGWGVPTENITPSDLRAMADHLERIRGEVHNDLGNRRDAGPIGGASVLTDGLAGKRTE